MTYLAELVAVPEDVPAELPELPTLVLDVLVLGQPARLAANSATTRDASANLFTERLLSRSS